LKRNAPDNTAFLPSAPNLDGGGVNGVFQWAQLDTVRGTPHLCGSGSAKSNALPDKSGVPSATRQLRLSLCQGAPCSSHGAGVELRPGARGASKFSFLCRRRRYGYGMDPSQTMSCPECGNNVAVTDRFCSKCFARLEPPGRWRKFLSFFKSAGRPGRHHVNIKKTVTLKTVDKDGERHEYHSLDEAPPEMRAVIEKLEAEALKEQGNCLSFTETSPSGNAVTSGMISRKTVSVYKVKDASGNERVYHSLDELPPEIQEAIRRAQTG
jgi:hypothetical protein